MSELETVEDSRGKVYTIHILEPKELARGTIKCVCVGEYAKQTIAETLTRRAEDIEKYDISQFPMSDPVIRQGALGRAKQLRELAELVKKLPTCPIVTE
jgi:hypothetical protein